MFYVVALSTLFTVIEWIHSVAELLVSCVYRDNARSEDILAQPSALWSRAATYIQGSRGVDWRVEVQFFTSGGEPLGI